METETRFTLISRKNLARTPTLLTPRACIKSRPDPKSVYLGYSQLGSKEKSSRTASVDPNRAQTGPDRSQTVPQIPDSSDRTQTEPDGT